jgi:glycosyltransferase involved in cell wall biosynthesis
MTMTKTTKKLKISVVIPMFNEEDTVEITLSEVVKSLKKYEGSYEIIFVDDCSTDDSIKYLKMKLFT